MLLLCDLAGTPGYIFLVFIIQDRSFLKNQEVDIKIAKKRNWVSFFLRNPLLSIAFIILALLSIIYVLPRLETGFLPEMDEGTIVLDYLSPPGTSLDETDRLLKEVEKIIVAIPEVQSYTQKDRCSDGLFYHRTKQWRFPYSAKK